jgi:hypothetical protein
MPKKPREAKHWVQDRAGQEIGPFIEEADARLCRATLNCSSPTGDRTVFERG